ncbi:MULTISPECIES: hypothetical protein [Burkholderia cepacia complex]|uniref:hypothetical protein n=1 Tax=Burkholderia cepacia complex TaxID=87882 RepID=UPI001CF3A799|nr:MULTISPECIES: hypothetical protein [Burkholderia cepacia complex]MCA8057159.1 hypothetical protein [Burkholderia cepacia]MDN7534651.1 hypothetical protein [Burkholderia orbicola]
MLLRWLIRSLCRTPAELRVVLMNVRAYRLHQQRPDDERAAHWKLDRRITRNVRLSLLTGLLIVQVESPQVFATGWIALPLAALLALMRVAGGLR